MTEARLGDPDAVDPDEAAVVAEATEDGDAGVDVRDLRTGTARAALRSAPFRRLWLATFSSNVGTWMQNVALGAFAYDLTGSSAFVAVVGFAQLGPLLLLAPVGGLLADRIDRRLLLVLTNLEQLLGSAALAYVAGAGHPPRGALIAVVLAIGIGNALAGPPLASLLPTLVPRADLPGAVSLQSVQMNLSRVAGPALGGVLLSSVHAEGVFAINAATYLFAVAGALSVRTARPLRTSGGAGLFGGVAVARQDPVVRSVLLTITAVSFFCLPFVGLMPVVAARNLHLDVNGLAYGLLYASFGLGAAAGAVAVGSLRLPQGRTVTAGLALFGLTLLGFGLLRSAAPAYPTVFAVGFFYFATVTTLATRLQQRLDDAVRGRVMALYMMGFGGTVPVGLLVGGAVAGVTSVTAVLVAGGLVAVALAFVRRPSP